MMSNDMTGAGFAVIFDAIGKYNTTLTSLNMSSSSSNGNMYIGAGLRGSQSLALMLANNSSLKELNISNWF